jgi:inosine-uridine nucleoside N-ribohydrolase
MSKELGVEILGITAVNGNTKLKNVLVNTAITLNLAGCEDLKVYPGIYMDLIGRM